MPRLRRAFTLVELLVVVLIIGVLAAIAIPKFRGTKDKTYVATMKSDLHNLATVQEAYFNDNANTYASDLSALSANYRPSSGVTITIGNVTASGWSATAAHSATSTTCSLSVGGAATGASEPVCN